jgi:hypothetical protein
MHYVETKIGSGGTTSVGDRLADIAAALSAVQRHPLGVGVAGVSNVLGLSLGVGWLRPLAEAGIIGFVAYVAALGTVAVIACKAALRDSGDVAAFGTIVVVIAFAALQRARIDESIWHWWLIAAFLRTYVSGRAFLSRGEDARSLSNL